EYRGVGSPRLLADAACCGDSLRNQRRVRYRGQVHEPDAIRPRVQQGGGDLKRQTGLAHTARACQRQQTCGGELSLHGGAFAMSTDETGELGWQIMSTGSRPGRVSRW